MVILRTVLLSHTDPGTESVLSTVLQGDLGLAVECIRPAIHLLKSRLATLDSAWLILDVDLIPAVTSWLRTGRYHLVAVVPSQADPRAPKLAQWGAAVLTAAEVPGYMAQWVTGPASSEAAPAFFVPRDGCQTVVLHSAKGGVGTSTIAVHLATLWARQGLSVGLVDLAPFGSAALLCKVQQRDQGLEPLLARLESDPALLESEGCDLQPFFTTVLSQPGKMDLLTAARPWILDRLAAEKLEQMLNQMRQLPYDRLIIDTSAEPTARNLATFSCADKLLLIGSPDYSCGWNLLTLKGMLDLLPLRAKRHLALNFSVPGAGMTADEYANRLGIPVDCEIPADAQLPKLSNQGVPWTLPDTSPFLQSVLSLATILDGQMEVANHG